jgi:hypothetical protein
MRTEKKESRRNFLWNFIHVINICLFDLQMSIGKQYLFILKIMKDINPLYKDK